MSDLVPEDADRLRSVVNVMRELGVAQAFGIVLGPPPPRSAVLAAKVEQTPGTDLELELAAERRREAIEAARAEIRLTVGASVTNLSDEACDKLIGADRLSQMGT